MLGFIGRWWRRRNRAVDRAILFPEIWAAAQRASEALRMARPMSLEEQREHARHGAQKMIMRHLEIDSAWQYPEEWLNVEADPLLDPRSIA